MRARVGGAPGEQAAARGARGWVVAALIALAVLPYANALNAGFVYDDSGLVRGHAAVQGEFSLSAVLTAAYWGAERAEDTALWRPLTTLTFALDDAVANDSARWMHATNIVLHAIVVVLGFGLALRLGASANVAAAAAALFAVHPLHTEAVTWISGRAELLAAIGVLLALRSVSAAHASLTRRCLGCAGATGLAMASKESAAFLPFAIAFLGWTQGPSVAALRQAAAPAAASLVVVLGFAALRASVLGTWAGPIVGPHVNPMSGTTLIERLPTVLDAAGRYLGLLVWPSALSNDYGPPVLGLADGLTAYALLGAVASVGLLGIAVKRAASLPGRAAGLAIGAFGVASNLLVVIGTNFAERLFYLPSYPLLWLGVWGACHLPIGRIALTAGLALLLAGGSARTWVQNRAYENDLTLADATLAAYPDAPKMLYNRARELARLGRFSEALAPATRAVELRPWDSWARIVLANALVGLERSDEAERRLREGLAIAPESPLERARLLELLLARDAIDEIDELAEWAAEQTALEAPWPARAALAAQRRGDLPLALERWQRVIELQPESASSWAELGRVAYATGDLTTSRDALERALALDASMMEAANGLAWLLLDEGVELPRALALAELAAGSRHPDHLDTLSRALDVSGRCDEALSAASEAAALDAEYEARRDALAEKCGRADATPGES